ncbi:FbpB family small basic protein [Alkalicoccus urumqiensis]|uniref:FbpB family small basic protein n=1 Tax=Alkalicoccus urumqiensis TaxID=1548213 RepID=A0A2P6MGL4_ALKUR|nr:FbpB family small basic protein [Alkalicoccus urumqiensis]PRO65426.1 FbpB family small basic protein [Alkalicoccus urumqiensis]
MRKSMRTTFNELVQQNKKEIMQDEKAIETIEARLDERHEQEASQSTH